MLKYHPIFVGWLIQHNQVTKLEGELTIYKKEEKQINSVSKWIPFKGLVTYSDGVKRIRYDSYDKRERFIEISLCNNGNYKNITESGIDILDIGNTCERYCSVQQFEDLLIKFSDILLDAQIYTNLPRFDGIAREHFIKMLENQIEFVKKNNYLFVGYYKFNQDILGDRIGWSDKAPQKVENIKKHGIFANTSIYERIVWDFDLVEKYKDKIMWDQLINKSNLIWNEDMLVKYERYIPFCNIDAETYCDKFATKIDYEKFGFLSNHFLDKYKDKLNWANIFKKCKINWNSEELKYFYQYVSNITLPFSEDRSNRTAGSCIQCYIEDLLDNKYFHWTTENLLSFLEVYESNWKTLIEKHRPQLFKVFLSITNIKEIADEHTKEISYFWEKVSNLYFPFDELSKEFTIDNIIKNIKAWSTPIKNEWLGMRRTPDYNYHYYRVITQWDILANHINVPLTYKLAKLLNSLDITIGGTFVESDGGYLEEDYRNPIVNALSHFSSHHIASENDIKLIIEDEELLESFLNSDDINLDIVKFLSDNFFSNFSVNDYIIIVNQMKDWNHIIKFNSIEKDEEEE